MTSPPPSPPAPPMRSALAKRLFALALAGAAAIFVAVVVPIRDRCVEPTTGAKLVRVDEGTGCRLERVGEPPLILAREGCDTLKCDVGLATILGRAKARPISFLGILAVYFLGTFAWALRWRELLLLAKLRISRRYTWRITLEAQAGGIILPGSVAGDALRIGAMVGKGVPLSTVVASVLLDRVIGLVTLASVAGVMALSTGQAFAAIGRGVALTLAAFPIGLVVGLLVVRAAPVARFLTEGPLARIAREPVLYLNDPKALVTIARATVVSVIVSVVQFVVIRGLVSVLGGVPTEPRWVVLGAAMAFMVAAVPLLPGGWGTSDAAFVFFFGFAGLSAQIALGVSLLYRAFWYLTGLVGAALRLFFARREVPTSTGP